MPVLSHLLYPVAIPAFSIAGNALILGNQLKEVKDEIQKDLEEVREDIKEVKKDIKGMKDDFHIPWAGASAVKCLGIPHQKSTYMVWPPNAPSNKQYGYIYESHIAYSHEYPLMVLVFESFCLGDQ